MLQSHDRAPLNRSGHHEQASTNDKDLQDQWNGFSFKDEESLLQSVHQSEAIKPLRVSRRDIVAAYREHRLEINNFRNNTELFESLSYKAQFLVAVMPSSMDAHHDAYTEKVLPEFLEEVKGHSKGLFYAVKAIDLAAHAVFSQFSIDVFAGTDKYLTQSIPRSAWTVISPFATSVAVTASCLIALAQAGVVQIPPAVAFLGGVTLSTGMMASFKKFVGLGAGFSILGAMKRNGNAYLGDQERLDRVYKTISENCVSARGPSIPRSLASLRVRHGSSDFERLD